jgi:hypothetical protein
MTTVATARLQIRDQSELLNQIAGTYKDFFRAAMEYVDNAVDAAAILRENGSTRRYRLSIDIDTHAKRVSFTDNCGGMTPQELCQLLSEVGRSRKKTVPWANGQFGFGVHAFRAFARQVTFVSRVAGREATITIDRSTHENVEVPCVLTTTRELDQAGTRVTIGRFDPQVFKKATFLRTLVAEIEHHFDDVLRSRVIAIEVSEDGGAPYHCQFLDFDKLPGLSLTRTLSMNAAAGVEISVALRVVDRVQEDRLPVITNKGRRVQTIADLKSFKNFARARGSSVFVWSNPFVVGGVEIRDACSPNLTRDDLRDSPAREKLYELLLKVQEDLEQLVDERMNSKTQESLKKLGNVMSDCLSRILRGFRLHFEQLSPSGEAGDFPQALSGPTAQDGGGFDGAGGDPASGWSGSGKDFADKPGAGPGRKAGPATAGAEGDAPDGGRSNPTVQASPGPRIEFQNHAGEDRVIDLGNSLIVNTQHPDFIARNSSKSGRIKLDSRLLNYISLVVSPVCVHRLFERRGRVASALEVGSNIVDLSTRLEVELVSVLVGQELDLATPP